MEKFEVKNIHNESAGEASLPLSVLKAEANGTLIHEVVVMQLANKRSGTHSTKTRAEVRGGGRKPWKQKGTGNARAGSNRSPLWRGGGIAFGPKPRDYSYTMPKKKIKGALRSILSSKYSEGRVVFLDSLSVTEGKTKEAVEILKRFDADRRVLIVVDSYDELVCRSFGNLAYANLLHIDGLNVYDLVTAHKIFILKSCLPRITEYLGDAKEVAL